ncbi:DUF4276 family protein [Pseudomonas sp. P7]|uniref:DUF4276 family protein n=1 Tax=Pseudomonas sivasensis TaxID=1880678 RepID=UPI0015EC4EFE|nr:DUF4276 family protein [Pseudomonas sivasensis]MBA2923581.1 DUF4276 family protein [Pseudomonas sivasensis]
MRKSLMLRNNEIPLEFSQLVIFVEGATDAAIVENILYAMNPHLTPTIVVCNGKHRIAKTIKNLTNDGSTKYIALIDADEPSVFDSREEAKHQLGNPSIPVFCAVPTIEAWLFADDKIASSLAKNESAIRTIERMPLPESIPYPKYLASQVLRITKSPHRYNVLRNLDIHRAAARSPSLRNFLAGICDVLELASDLPDHAMSSTVSRDIFSTLLRELPGDAVAWRTLAGEIYSAAELARNIGEGTEIGKQYVTELLRVARDFTLRKAKK